MGIVKKFNEWLNESVSSVKSLTDNIYQALVDAGLGDNFNAPEYNDESSYLTAQADSYGFGITDEVDCIPFGEGSTFDYDKYIFYGIYITDEAPINDRGDTASVIIEYGEDDYTDGPEPWALYYSAKEDNWDGNGPIKNPGSELANLICVISQAINPETKYHSHRPEKGSDDVLDDGTLEDLYKYLIDNYENLGDEEISFNKGKDSDGIWYEIQIPVTLSGLKLESEPYVGYPGESFSIDIKPELEKYLEPETYDEVSEEILDEHGVLRIFTDPEAVTNSGIVRVLDGLLKNVPDPALRKK